MNIKKTILCAAATASAILMASDTPEVSNVTMTQASFGRQVTIIYQLNNAPNGAVVTLDVQTNRTGAVTADDADWFSIGGEAVCNAQGDVWKKVAQGSHTITWRPDLSWEGHKMELANGGARAVVTAWALDNTPDYMVVDVSSAAQPNTQTYYPGADFLPGGILGNLDYRTTKIVMRKIMAKDVKWTMGSTPMETARHSDGRENTHSAVITNNYYIGVFEISQDTWNLVCDLGTIQGTYFTVDRPLRPMENICYNEVRMGRYSTVAADGSQDWPAPPFGTSFLGRLRTKTGLDFDLPSEAQWEFAARAGHGDTQWGDGTAILNSDNDGNLNRIGRYSKSGGYINGTTAPGGNCPIVDGGTAAIGSYAPNDWGLYDMNGNVAELCLDFFANNVTSLTGAVNTVVSSTGHISKGGSYRSTTAGDCRPASRGAAASNARNNNVGVRVVCTAGLK